MESIVKYVTSLKPRAIIICKSYTTLEGKLILANIV